MEVVMSRPQHPSTGTTPNPMCIRCGMTRHSESSRYCRWCEGDLASGADRPTRAARTCPVCGEEMRMDDSRAPASWRCSSKRCRASIDTSTARLAVPGVEPDRAEGKSVVGANRIIRKDAKERLASMEREESLRQVFDRVRKYGHVTENCSVRELTLLTLEHESEAIRREAFGMLAERRLLKSAGEGLERIAESDSEFAELAKALLESP